MNKVAGALLAGLLLAAPVLGAETPDANHSAIPRSSLIRYGANPRTVALALIAPDNHQILMTDDPPFLQKKKGATRRIWTLDLDDASTLR